MRVALSGSGGAAGLARVGNLISHDATTSPLQALRKNKKSPKIET
jgi:hypothetical protein